MGFPRQEYWSGVPLPSPKAALGLQKKLSLKYRNFPSILMGTLYPNSTLPNTLSEFPLLLASYISMGYLLQLKEDTL